MNLHQMMKTHFRKKGSIRYINLKKKKMRIIEIIKNRLRIGWIMPRTWRENGKPFYSWVYSFKNHATKSNDHFLQLSIIGLNIAFKHRIEKNK